MLATVGTMASSSADLLKAQTAQAFATAVTALDDMTADEYWWEPHPGAWSVRPRNVATDGWGTGSHVCEDTWPPPTPVPITTIAWRVCHLAAWTDVYDNFTFGDCTASLDGMEVPTSVEAGVQWVRDTQQRFIANIDEMSDDDIGDLRPVHWGDRLAAGRIVSMMIAEHVHHLAEIALLRDLHRGSARFQDEPPTPAGPDRWAQLRIDR